MIFLSLDNTWVEIDLDAIVHNFDAVRAKAGVPVMAVIKADAYGHGAVEVGRLLQDRCAFFGVSSIWEALELRRAGLTIPILIQYFRGSFGKVEMGPMMASIMMNIIPIIIVYLLCQKHIIKGVAAGAVKG